MRVFSSNSYSTVSPHSNVNKLRECNLKLLEIFEFYVSQNEAFFPLGAAARAPSAAPIATPPLFIERLQPIKFVYALQLLSIGNTELAFRYCEALSRLVVQAAQHQLLSSQSQCLLYAMPASSSSFCSSILLVWLLSFEV